MFFATALLIQIYFTFGILFACGKHLHDRIISLKLREWLLNAK